MSTNEKYELISRKEAIEKGLKSYFTGEPCKRGHISLRNVRACSCLQCQKEEYARRHPNRVARKPKAPMETIIDGTKKITIGKNGRIYETDVKLPILSADELNYLRANKEPRDTTPFVQDFIERHRK